MFDDDFYILRDRDGINYSTKPAAEQQRKRQEAEDQIRYFLFSHLVLVNDTVHELTNHYPSPDVLATIAGDLLLTAMKGTD